MYFAVWKLTYCALIYRIIVELHNTGEWTTTPNAKSQEWFTVIRCRYQIQLTIIAHYNYCCCCCCLRIQMFWRQNYLTNSLLVDGLVQHQSLTSPIVVEAMKAVDRGNYAPVCPYADAPQPICTQNKRLMHRCSEPLLNDRSHWAWHLGLEQRWLRTSLHNMIGWSMC